MDPQAPLAYQINFQNKPEALGPAEQVVVTHKLDPNLDLDTFELGDFGFGDLTVTVPSGRQFYSTRLDLRSTRGVFVDVTAELDRATRTATWTFQALDPTTMDLPIDPLVGFLPPDQTAPEGEGFVSFSVGPEADLPTGTRIDARATVVFDTNAPLDTNVFTNALDGGPPASSVNALPASTPATSFTVSWSGSDEGGLGSGIASYDVFVSVDGGPFTPFLLATTQTSATFTGADRHTYGFYSVATDNLGHREATPTGAQATTRVSLGIAPTLTSAGGATFTVGTAGRFTVTTSPSDPAAVALRESGALPAGVTFTDNGDGTATLAGTPTAGGAFSFVITAANGIAPDAAQTFVLTVNPPAITLTPALSSARVGVAYRQTITAGGGTAPYGQFVITSGGLPAGLSLDSATGVLSGTPTAGGTFGFTVRATDASTGTGPFTGSRSYALTVAPPSLVIDPAPPAPARVGVAFSQAVSARGGTAPYHFRLAGGSLPPGVALDPGTGILGGIPRTPGTFRFVVRVTDSSTGTGPFGSGRALTLAVGQGSPARLVFLTQVGSAALNGQLPTFRVLVLDQFGNRVSGVVVRLALVPVMAVGPAGFGAGSVVQATAADGVATFGHVTVRTRGRYRLRAFAGLGGALSNPFDVGLNGRQG